VVPEEAPPHLGLPEVLGSTAAFTGEKTNKDLSLNLEGIEAAKYPSTTASLPEDISDETSDLDDTESSSEVELSEHHPQASVREEREDDEPVQEPEQQDEPEQPEEQEEQEEQEDRVGQEGLETVDETEEENSVEPEEAINEPQGIKDVLDDFEDTWEDDIDDLEEPRLDEFSLDEPDDQEEEPSIEEDIDDLFVHPPHIAEDDDREEAAPTLAPPRPPADPSTMSAGEYLRSVAEQLESEETVVKHIEREPFMSDVLADFPPLVSADDIPIPTIPPQLRDTARLPAAAGVPKQPRSFDKDDDEFSQMIKRHYQGDTDDEEPPLVSFDEQFPTDRLHSTPLKDPEEMFSRSPRHWSDELQRPLDKEMEKQARVQLAVAKRLEGARKRRSSQQEGNQ
jgi:hypothetical protein